MGDVAAFSCICEEDAWLLDQYLTEVERLDIPFGMHMDRCSAETKLRIENHPLCFGTTVQDDPKREYTEQDKQAIFDMLYKSGRRRRWALHWDVDEIWDKDAPDKLRAIINRSEDLLYVKWVNCWGDLEHIRVDTVFASSRRVKLYNISQGRRWLFDHPITYGCKMVGDEGLVKHGAGVHADLDLVCLHTGLMTRELREFHKARWDRILTTAVGNNPLGFWEYCVREADFPPTVIPNPYR